MTVNLAWATQPVQLVINALVAFRLTQLWLVDMLPPLPRLRARLLAMIENRWDRRTLYRPSMPAQEIERRRRARTLYPDQPPLAYLLDCWWCAGFWISLAVFLAASLVPATVWTIVAVPFALSAAVGLLAARQH